MFSKIMFTLPILAALLPAAIAIPLEARDAQAATAASATAVTYFVANACDSSYNRAFQTISSGDCMNLGAADTTRSLQVNKMNPAESSCMIQVYNNDACLAEGKGNMMMQLPMSSGNSTCVGGQAAKTIGRLGSAMMVC